MKVHRLRELLAKLNGDDEIHLMAFSQGDHAFVTERLNVLPVEREGVPENPKDFILVPMEGPWADKKWSLPVKENPK